MLTGLRASQPSTCVQWPCSITATEDLLMLLRREGLILSTQFARIDPTACFFLFHLNRRRRGMTIGGSVKAHAFQRKSGQFIMIK